jgi:cell division protein FtsI (penicillin-binding protein 3)
MVLDPHIAGPNTLNALRSCLEGVCNEEGGTAYQLFKDSPFKVAGKTGTSLVAKPHRGYVDQIHLSSFAGYFPADKPRYSCIVVIENCIGAKFYYGGKIAAPVFKEVADKLYALEINEQNYKAARSVYDSASYFFAGRIHEFKEMLNLLGWNYRDSAGTAEWGQVYAHQSKPVLASSSWKGRQLPDLQGMGMKDALYVVEKMGLVARLKGRGKLVAQSLPAGTMVKKKDIIELVFN